MILVFKAYAYNHSLNIHAQQLSGLEALIHVLAQAKTCIGPDLNIDQGLYIDLVLKLAYPFIYFTSLLCVQTISVLAHKVGTCM